MSLVPTERCGQPYAVLASSYAVLVIAVTVLLAGCSSPSSPTPIATTPPTTVAPIAPTPPLAIACPGSIAATTTTGSAVPVSFPAASVSGGVAPVTVSCTRESGTAFAPGAAQVQCTARDAANNSAGCAFSVTVTAVAPRLARTRFLAFGDSVTAGEVTLSTSSTARSTAAGRAANFVLAVLPSLSYPTRLREQLRARYTAQPSIEVTNAGVPGEWAEDGVARLSRLLTTLNPEVVLLLEGANDVSALGQPGVTRAAQALEKMAKDSRFRGARVFMATVTPVRPPSKSQATPAQLMALNSLIRQIAGGEGAVLVDVYAALSADLPRYIGADGLHPTEAGYLRIAERFFDAVRADLEVR